MQELKKIVIIGPESTGKSTLSAQLAEYFNTIWCPEYAREYLTKHGKEYSYDNLLTIAKGQLALEDECVMKMENGEWGMENNQKTKNKENSTDFSSFNYHPQSFTVLQSPLTTRSQSSVLNSPLIFIDTNMYVMKVWCEYVFGKCHQFILDEIVNREYDLYLLCNIDLPWIADELREYPAEEPRKELYNIYKDILINQNTPWVEISGNYEERLQKAIESVNAGCQTLMSAHSKSV
ncbi:MAG: AAA family ATPase [Chitinophagaceae bacterium]